MMSLKTNRILQLVLFTVSLLFAACNNTPALKEKTNDTTGAALQDSTANRVADSPPADISNARILNTSDYHGDEVEAGIAKRAWIGLFRNAEGFYLDTTRLHTETIFDPVLDEDEAGKHTGIRVTVSHKDTALLLLSGVPGLKTGRVSSVATMKAGEYPVFVVHPGDSIRFSYNGAAYTLLARAKKTPVADQPEAYTLSDYRLYLSGLKEGKIVQQLLTAQATLDDAEVGILFCGDLDGDHIPDFVINTSGHYNVFQPTLYLSAGAGKDRWLRMIAKHTSVGC